MKKIGEGKKRQKNLVKGVKTAISMQVIENGAKINLQSMSQLPFATCYSEYIE
jgi:hypothetical protein